MITTPFVPGIPVVPGGGYPPNPPMYPPGTEPTGGGWTPDIPGIPEPLIPTIGGSDCCGAGQACSGLCVDTILGSMCAGKCNPIAETPQTQCPPGTHLERTPYGTNCVADGESFGPTIPGIPGTPQGNGCQCGSTTSCTLPNGRKGRTNKSKYYRFGDCRRGTSAGVVPAGSVCVTPRRTNYGNDKAAMRAARRLNGAARHYHKIIDAVDNISKAKRRKPSRR